MYLWSCLQYNEIWTIRRWTNCSKERVRNDYKLFQTSLTFYNFLMIPISSYSIQYKCPPKTRAPSIFNKHLWNYHTPFNLMEWWSFTEVFLTSYTPSTLTFYTLNGIHPFPLKEWIICWYFFFFFCGSLSPPLESERSPLLSRFLSLLHKSSTVVTFLLFFSST